MDDESDGQPEPIEIRVGEILRAADATVAVAESCTGGLVGSLITDAPGASDYFECSVVTYSYDTKRALLAVSRETLDTHGAVSEPVAREMARAVCDIADTTWGVSTTGISGPTGGSDEKPVGTVYIGVANAAPWGTGNSKTSVERYEFDGSRRERKEMFARQAMRDLEARLQRDANR